MLIGELAERTGVAAHLLRYYETQGLLGPVRGPNGYRSYDADAPEAVERIRNLLEAGLSTTEIRSLLPCATGTAPELEACTELLATLRGRRSDIERRIDTLTRSRELLDRYLAATEPRGAPDTISPG